MVLPVRSPDTSLSEVGDRYSGMGKKFSEYLEGAPAAQVYPCAWAFGEALACGAESYSMAQRRANLTRLAVLFLGKGAADLCPATASPTQMTNLWPGRNYYECHACRESLVPHFFPCRKLTVTLR